jgi:omega-amidase
MRQLKLGLVQTQLHWENPTANRAHLESKIEAVASADLIILPEMFSTGFSMSLAEHAEEMSGETVSWLANQAKAHDTAICGSVMVKENGGFYNRFLLFAPHQDPITYNKRHLFRMADEHQHYTPGSDRIVFELKGVRICPQVCYDLRFPVFSRNQNDYDLLLYVANWPARRAHHWRSLLTARAIENLAYVAAVNRVGTDGNGIEYCGDSGLINANGEWIGDLKDQDTCKMLTLDMAPLEEYRTAFPAWQDADSFSFD